MDDRRRRPLSCRHPSFSSVDIVFPAHRSPFTPSLLMSRARRSTWVGHHSARGHEQKAHWIGEVKASR